MIRQHDLEQLPVETIRPRLDFRQIQARLEIEIVGHRAVLEIQIDQAGGRFAALAAAFEHEHGGLHRQRGDAGAADRGQKGANLRLGRLGAAGAILADARAGAHQVDRRHRLDQEIGDPHLQQGAGDGLVEALRHRDHRRPGPHARHQPRQRLHLVVAAGVEIDHHNGRGFDIERIAALLDPSRHNGEFDRVRGVEGGVRGTIELGVGGEHHHAGTAELGLALRPMRMTSIYPAYFTDAADCVTVGPTGD